MCSLKKLTPVRGGLQEGKRHTPAIQIML